MGRLEAWIGANHSIYHLYNVLLIYRALGWLLNVCDYSWEHLQLSTSLLRIFSRSRNSRCMLAAFLQETWGYTPAIPHHCRSRTASLSIHDYGRGYLCYCSHASSNDGREQGKEQIDRCPFIEVPGDGSAMIFGPDGAPLVEPLPGRRRDPLCWYWSVNYRT